MSIHELPAANRRFGRAIVGALVIIAILLFSWYRRGDTQLRMLINGSAFPDIETFSAINVGFSITIADHHAAVYLTEQMRKAARYQGDGRESTSAQGRIRFAGAGTTIVSMSALLDRDAIVLWVADHDWSLEAEQYSVELPSPVPDQVQAMLDAFREQHSRMVQEQAASAAQREK